jgi:hypothetical protein
MFTPQRVVTKTLSNACAMGTGSRVQGIGSREEIILLFTDIIE